MFHLLADDTGASAVWAAQRVPDDHITAVANQFVIGEIDLGDPTNFMASGRVQCSNTYAIIRLLRAHVVYRTQGH
jgi:Peptidase family C69